MSETETVICCIIVSNPAGGTRPRGWQKRVNDHIRSLAKMAALQPDDAAIREAALREALAAVNAKWRSGADTPDEMRGLALAEAAILGLIEGQQS